MLQDILEHPAASPVLGFLLAATPRSYSVLELSKRSGVGASRLALVLPQLVREGYVATFQKKSKRYYIISDRHPLLHELRTKVLKGNAKYQDELISAIRKVGSVKAAYLSGIFTGQPQLPVDMLLVGRPSLGKLAVFVKQLEKLYGQEINYSIMSEQEFDLRRHAFDRFIRDIFDYRHVIAFETGVDKKPAAVEK